MACSSMINDSQGSQKIILLATDKFKRAPPIFKEDIKNLQSFYCINYKIFDFNVFKTIELIFYESNYPLRRFITYGN